jgi:RNA recognition motif-containing protein
MQLASVPLGIVEEYEHNDLEMVLKFFREHGTGFELKDANGNSALMHAATAGRMDVCAALLALGIGSCEEAAICAERAGFFDLSLRLVGVNLGEKPKERFNYKGPFLGSNRHQNLVYLAQQLSTPLAVRLENVSLTASSEKLAEWMESHGARPSRLRLAADPISGKLSGFAFASFTDRTSLQMAVKLNGQSFQDRKVKVFIDEALIAGTAGGESPCRPDWVDSQPHAVSKKANNLGPKKITRFDLSELMGSS